MALYISGKIFKQFGFVYVSCLIFNNVPHIIMAIYNLVNELAKEKNSILSIC